MEEVKMITIQADYLIIAITSFGLWSWISYKITRGAISALKLIDNSSNK